MWYFAQSEKGILCQTAVETLFRIEITYAKVIIKKVILKITAILDSAMYSNAAVCQNLWAETGGASTNKTLCLNSKREVSKGEKKPPRRAATAMTVAAEEKKTCQKLEHPPPGDPSGNTLVTLRRSHFAIVF